MIKLGIDVGGTNTDAILTDASGRILAEIKIPTSQDISSGIQNAIHEVLRLSGAAPSDIGQAMLGTTQCTNAIVERKNLARFAVLRIGAPASTGIEPMTDWDPDLKSCCCKSAIIGGGFEYDGREIAPFDEKACRDFFRSVKNDAESIAVSCVFSTVRDDHEQKARMIAREILGEDIPISLSCEIGSMGLIERENAAILNAALHRVAMRFTEGFAQSLANEGICNAAVYLSQNDGTLMTINQALRYPILTIACGPTNSIRGAGSLCDLADAIVIDVGGTTTDLGVIRSGFPRESSTAANIGGVRTNFRMPDVLSIGLGGGSIIRQSPNGKITVGPDSVGYRITQEALVFGGQTMTATDIAVRLGMAQIGDPARVTHIDQVFANQVMEIIRDMTDEALDHMKSSGTDTDVILVGGGSVILPSEIPGASRVLRPEHFGVANAIGSAISNVSGSSEQLFDYEQISREDALTGAREEAIRLAIEAGADPDTVEIVDVEEIPLSYHPGNTCKVKIKAAGSLQ